MNRLLAFSILLLTLLSLTFCQQESESVISLEDYFFPFDSMVTPRVYVNEFKDENDSVWYEYSRLISNGNIMAVEMFDSSFKPSRLLIDSMGQDGIYLIEGQETFDGKACVAEIYNPLIFPFQSNKRVDFTVINGPEEMKYEQRAKLTFSHISNVEFKNKSYECAIFNMTIIMNGSWFTKYSGKTVYAKGIGIIETSYYLGEDTNSYRLIDIISEQEFDSLANQAKY